MRQEIFCGRSVTVSTSGTCVEAVPAHATQAYVGYPSLQKTMQDYWDVELIKHRRMTEAFVLNEHALKDTHYALYHSHKKSLCLLQDFLTLLAQAEGKNTSDCISLRSQAAPYKDAQSFLAAEYDEACYNQQGIMYHFDKPSRITAMILCANLAVYGIGAENLGHITGESSFEFFRLNRSFGGDMEHCLEAIFDEYGFDKRYIDSLSNLAYKHFMGAQGSFVQLLIPKNLVNKCVYISYLHGRPVTSFTINGEQRLLTTVETLELMRTNPLSFTDRKQFTSLQARVLFTPEMLTSDSGVKVIRAIGGMSAEKYACYQQELKIVTRQIVASATKKKLSLHQDTMVLQGVDVVQLPVSKQTEKEVAFFFDIFTYQARLGKAVADNNFVKACKIFYEESQAHKRAEAAVYVLKNVACHGTLEQAAWLVDYCKADVYALYNSEESPLRCIVASNPEVVDYLKNILAQQGHVIYDAERCNT